MTAGRSAALVRAGLLGAASGSRSTFGLVALGLTVHRGHVQRPLARLGLVAAAAVEVVIDKLPVTPSRLQARGLVSRAVGGGLSGLIVAHPRSTQINPDLADQGEPAGGREQQLAAGAVGVLAALAAAFAGAGWRALCDRRVGSDAPGALAEDAVAATLAALAVTGR